MSSPPRFVPTLTEVVVPVTPATDSAIQEGAGDSPSPAGDEAVVQDVLRRVDLVLERRLREAIGELVSQHSDALAHQLRSEIERVVRQSVAEAMAQSSKSFGA